MENTLLNIDHLSVCLDTPSGTVQAVRDVSLTLHEGEVLALVGESGCGKSMLCRSIMKLLPQNARITSGSITVNGVDITAYRERDMRRLRGKVFSMIFQDPLTALDPAMPVDRQIAEAVRTHRGRMERSAVDSRVAELLALVGVELQQGAQYPHQLSGGQRQRCLMAMALAGEPKILLADEPTGNLDANNAWEIMKLMEEINEQGTTVVVVTHNLEIVKAMNKRVITMQKGVVVDDTASDHYGKDTSVEQDDDLFDDFLDDGGDDDYAN